MKTINELIDSVNNNMALLNKAIDNLHLTPFRDCNFYNPKEILPELPDGKGLVLGVCKDRSYNKTREMWYENGKFYLGLTTYNGATEIELWAYMPSPKR